MRIVHLRVRGFRCLDDLETSFESVTVLVGANSAGKSTLLHALRWFFEGGRLEPDDHARQAVENDVSVGATFDDLNQADLAALEGFVIDGRSTLRRTWSASGGEALVARGRAYSGFAEVRATEGAMPRRQAYAALRGARPELQLPAASSVAAVDAALGTWEAAHPGELEEADIDAGRLANAVGGAWLNGRVDFVMVPAVADPEAETRDVRGTLLRQLLDRALGEQSAMRERLGELERRVTEDMREIVEDEGGQALVDLASSVSEELDRLVPGGQVLLEPRPSLIRLPVFGVDVRVADGELETDVGHQGHGFQRALLIAVVQRLAAMRPPPRRRGRCVRLDSADALLGG